MPLPPYAPELNPVEQLWLNIKQRYLSNMALVVLLKKMLTNTIFKNKLN
jgi:transposase